MKRAGSSLVSVLLVSTLCVILAFTVAGVSVSHLGVANRRENAQLARLNAEAAAQHLVSLICENPKLGTPQGPPSGSLSFEVAVNGGVGRVSFDSGAFGIPPSFNNLASDRAVSAYQRTLPPHSMQIISQGLYRNEKRTLETILAIPPYKYALATTGEFRSNGNLQVMGVDSLEDLADGLQALPKEKIKPGHLASNSQKNEASDPAVDLRADAAHPTLISGDALAVGSLHADARFVTIQGAPRGGAEPTVIPKINLANYDPALMKSGYQNLAGGRYDSGMNVTSALRYRGDLNVSGGLNLNDGFLYVDGNINIQGGVHGKGVIMATHNVSVQGRASLSATDSVGLAAGGNVSLTGQATNPAQMNANTFRGVIYTEGDFQAQGLQLVGTVLGNKSGAEGSRMTLTDVNLIHHPASIEVDWSNGWQPDLGTPDPYWSRPASWAASKGQNPDDYTVDRIIFNHHTTSLSNLAYSPQQLEELDAAAVLPNRDSLLDKVGDEYRTVFAHDLSSIQAADYFPPLMEHGNGGDSLGLPPNSGLTDHPLLPQTPWYRLAQQQIKRERDRTNPANSEGPLSLDGINSLWWTKRWDGNGFDANSGLSTRGPMQFVFALHTKSGKLFNSPCDYVTYVYQTLGPEPGATVLWGDQFSDPEHDQQFARYIQLALERVAEYDRNYAEYLRTLHGRSVLDGSIKLDPNQFVQLQDKMKRILVREITL
ncbi:hypothetical protein JST97_03155 [bacterium]|nr:hypothetical protein [bacterium]